MCLDFMPLSINDEPTEYVFPSASRSQQWLISEANPICGISKF